jgi:hypothetical protein
MKGGGKQAAPRESRSFTVLLILQLVLVAVLVAVQYPALLARAAQRLGGKPLRSGGRGGVGVGALGASRRGAGRPGGRCWLQRRRRR